jgi:hypothetical protein
MNARAWAWASVATGLAAIAIFVAFAMLPEVKAAGTCLPAGSVVQFELARNAADLIAIFGPPTGACRPLAVAAMDGVNMLDTRAFIPTYTAFCICAALFLSGGVAGRPLALAAIGAAIVALAGDYLETFTLLNLSHRLDAPNALLPSLELGAWTKFTALAVHALACAGLCFTGDKRRNILGVLLIPPALGLAAAAYNHVTLASAMDAAFAIAWIALLIVALLSALRGAPKATA